MAYQFRTFLVIFGLFALLALTSLLIVQKTLLTNYTTASQDITLTSENELTEALRGKIYDRHGTELVRNEVIFQLCKIGGSVRPGTVQRMINGVAQRFSNTMPH